jgi:hypothetical protein
MTRGRLFAALWLSLTLLSWSGPGVRLLSQPRLAQATLVERSAKQQVSPQPSEVESPALASLSPTPREVHEPPEAAPHERTRRLFLEHRALLR